jgi:signal transduction histidine kinase/ligand-binding sensor domain-containing protein/DNA-binding response OmpR family regulator
MKKFLLILAVFVSSLSWTYAAIQGGHFISSDRFSSGLINDVYQDKYGYVWVATDYGLNRFDGYRFTTYRNKPSDETSVGTNIIATLKTDRDGQLWVGTAVGLDRYDYATDTFVHYKFDRNVRPRVTEIIERSDGKLLVGTAGYGLYLLSDIHDEAGVLHHMGDKYGAGKNNSFFSYMLEDSRHRVWKSSYDNHLVMRDASGLHYMEASKGDVAGILEMSDGSVMIVCTHGLQQSNGRNLADADMDMSVIGGKEVNFTCALRDHEGNIYIGSRGNGLFCLPNGSRKLERVACITKDFDLNTAKVCAITEDKNGNLWLGCEMMGLVMLERTPPQFQTWGFQTQGVHLCSTISSVCHGDGGITWCTVPGNGVFGFDKDGHITAHPASPPLTQCLYRDTEGRYWVGTNQGVYAYNPLTGSSQQKMSLDCDGFNDMVYMGDNKLYVSAFSRGFCMLDIATGQVRSFRSQDNNGRRGSLCNNWVVAMMPDRNGRLWLATADGVSCYDPHTDSFRSLGFEKLLPGILCSSLCETSQGDILIGTDRGLFVYKSNLHKAVLFHDGDALVDKAVCYIVEANGGDIWCSTSAGLWQYDIRRQCFISHISDNGLSGKEYIVGVGQHTDNNIIFFANNEGVVAFNPSQVVNRQQALPAVTLTNFILAGRAINTTTLSDGTSIITRPVMESDHFRLSYLDNTFVMEFSLLNYDQPNNVVFEYRIDDGEWQQNPEGYNSVHLSHMQPGTYKLEVRALFSGTYSASRVFTIVITPPWYKSTLAIIIYIMLLLSLVAFIGWMWHRHATQQLDEEKMKFLINATHDIRSPLTLIMGAVSKLKGVGSTSSPKSAEELNTLNASVIKPSVDAIDRNAQRLMLLVNQILDERRLDKNQMRLHCRETDLVQFINVIYKLYQYNASQRDIRFAFEHDSDRVMAWIDRINFDKVLSNLLSNAFKYSFDGGEVKVVLRELEKEIEIQVIDAGLGIKQDDVDHLFDRFYQGRNADDLGMRGTGIGLNLSKAITEMHGGQIKAGNRDDGQRGACFTVTLPKGNDHLKPEQIVTETPTEKPQTVIGSGVRQSRPFNILIVDDDIEIANYIMDELGGRYRFSHAPNGREGLKMLLTANSQQGEGQQQAFDLVVSDVMMPEMDGISMLRRIKKNPQVSQVPVIMLTSKAEVEHKLEGLKSGADAYIAKPFNMEELHIQIDNLIDNVRRLRGKFSGAVQQENRMENIEIKDNDDALMERIMKSINAHISESDFNVDSLCSDVGISRAQLHRKMKEMTGIASGKFLRNLRMEQAARLLRESKVNVSQVAYRVGYADQAHFSTAFKAHFGLSPSEYAEQHKNMDE